jgi:hypothetical protein
MAKKVLLVMVLAAIVAGGAFAVDFKISAGVGGFVGGDFGGGAELTANMLGIKIIEAYKTSYFGGGGYGFFDLTFAELSVGYFYGSGQIKSELSATGIPIPSTSSAIDYYISSLTFGLLGKLPIAISDKLIFFPALGIDYQMVLSLTDEDGNSAKNWFGQDAAGDFSALWFKAGAGIDFFFTDSIYLRFTALYGIRLTNQFEKDTEAQLNVEAALLKAMGLDISTETKTLLGHGLTAKLAIGFCF